MRIGIFKLFTWFSLRVWKDCRKYNESVLMIYQIIIKNGFLYEFDTLFPGLWEGSVNLSSCTKSIPGWIGWAVALGSWPAKDESEISSGIIEIMEVTLGEKGFLRKARILLDNRQLARIPTIRKWPVWILLAGKNSFTLTPYCPPFPFTVNYERDLIYFLATADGWKAKL